MIAFRLPGAITSGVVQGSVPGPLLFSLYSDNTFKVIRHRTPLLFADDSKIVNSLEAGSINSTTAPINKYLTSLEY